MDVPVEILDREVARAHAALVAARRDLAQGEGADIANPLTRHERVTRRATFVDLAEAKDPLAIGVRRWVHALTLERVLWADTARLATAWRDPRITLIESAKLPILLSAKALVLAILREPDAIRRKTLAEALAKGASHVRDAATIYAERRREASRLLGASVDAIDAIDAIENPVEPSGALAPLAERLLAETSPFVLSSSSTRARGWTDALSRALGRDAAEGWPARINVRWLVDLFDGPLTEGLRLEVGTLPAALGASSFARALGRFGAALADVDGPSGWFCVGRSPFDLRVHRRAALFASLPSDPNFMERALGLGKDRARAQARRLAGALLTTVRLDAARVLCRDALTRPASERSARFEEATGKALGIPVPSSLVGVLPRLDPSSAVQFVGLLLAASDRRRLIDRYDEDWFRSPHAARALREEDAATALAAGGVPTVKEEDVRAGMDEMVRVLKELG